ncbi:transketolase [Arthrobacter crystallopoietes BAB-32]|uniref:Transketolase n=1 Tax=Arthrobacter crystallopoietes BAB-32 TaxID=1246476 RepID=N1V7B4_9MICC|nr:1-deoxy-D-xylulose-5-phosphate synthase N-terminal domain-containing protein [Arthrobacter crystallopoietes]EMY36002.1 transketolase [Arthrobacter crystallopoietes BAB-32]
MNIDLESPVRRQPPADIDPRRLAAQIRLEATRMVAPQGFGYLGQALSSAEQVAAVFADLDWDRDRFVCSPGHYIIAPYAAAGALGLLSREELDSYGKNGSSLEAIGTESSPIVDYTCGSLGQGLSAAAGFALADKLRGGDAGRVFALISDGELEEGQTWEAAIFAAHHGLDRMIVILDANDSQVDGPISAITTLEPMREKWESFGWHVADIDGHDIDAVVTALRKADAEAAKPSVLICRTSTVHGLDCLPEDADGHFIKLPPQLAAAAEAELTRTLETL